MSVPQAAPLGDAAPPPQAAPATASHDVVAEAQAFLDQAFASGDLSGDDAGADAPIASDAAAQDANGATPATPDATASAEDAAAEAQQQTRRTRRQREDDARAKAQAAPATSEPSAPAAQPEQQPPPAPPAKSRDEIIAEWQREQEQQAEATRQAEERRTRFARWTGDVPADPAAPTGETLYQRLQAVANQPIPSLGYDADQQAFDARERVISDRNRAQAQLREYDERRGMLNALAEPAERNAWQRAVNQYGQQVERGIAALGLDVQAAVAAGSGKPEPLVTLVENVGRQMRALVEAELRPQIADLTEERDALASEISELRTQLGGRAPQVTRGGVSAQPVRPSLEALDALRPTSVDDLSVYLDMLPAATRRR